jgi:hypothetical protein
VPAARPAAAGCNAWAWRDFASRCPAIGLFYGACFMVMGWALLKVFYEVMGTRRPTCWRCRRASC